MFSEFKFSPSLNHLSVDVFNLVSMGPKFNHENSFTAHNMGR